MLYLATAPPLGLQNTTGCTCTTAHAVPSQVSSRSASELLQQITPFLGAMEVDLSISQHPPIPIVGLLSYSNMSLLLSSFPIPKVPFALVTYRKGCCKCSFWRQTRSHKTKLRVKTKQCFPFLKVSLTRVMQAGRESLH